MRIRQLPSETCGGASSWRVVRGHSRPTCSILSASTTCARGCAATGRDDERRYPFVRLDWLAEAAGAKRAGGPGRDPEDLLRHDEADDPARPGARRCPVEV